MPNPKRPRRVDKALYDKMLALMLEGKTISHIAKTCGISVSTVRKARDHGFYFMGLPPLKREVEKIRALSLELQRNELAQEFVKVRQALSQWLDIIMQRIKAIDHNEERLPITHIGQELERIERLLSHLEGKPDIKIKEPAPELPPVDEFVRIMICLPNPYRRALREAFLRHTFDPEDDEPDIPVLGFREPP